MSASGLDHHLATCPACAQWAQQATALTRQARVGPAVVPDLVAAITEQVVLPVGRVLRRRARLRMLLFLAGLAQLIIAIPALGGDSIGMAMSTHAAHEAAAWNLAIGAAFVAAAFSPRRAAGLVPVLATFVVVLGALSVHDVAAGAVTAGRLCTHLGAVLGLVLVIALDRAERALPPTRFAAGQPHAQPGQPGQTAATDDDHGGLHGVA
jgi:predicted anti-sigma-YlaC factor YlaD